MDALVRVAATAIAAFPLLLMPSTSLAREWVNDQGKKLDASFIRLRDETAFLRADGKLIRAPIERLSESDQQWIARHEELTASREWGDAKAEGQFKTIRTEGFEVRSDKSRLTIPFADLTVADFTIVADYYAHTEQELPDEFAVEQASALARAPAPRPEGMLERQWTDVRGRELTAEFEGTRGEKALLWKGDRRFEFPLAKLSPDDLAWIARQNLNQLMADLQGGVAAASSIASAAAESAARNALQPSPQATPSEQQASTPQ